MEERGEQQKHADEQAVVAPAATSVSPTSADIPKTKKLFFGAALLLIVSAAAGFGGGYVGGRSTANTPQMNVQKQQVVLKTQGQLLSQIAKNVGASVVSVNTTSQGARGGLFGSTAAQQRGAGTGVILTADGLIMTNRHVVPAGVSKVTVTLSDGTTFDNVQVVGRTTTRDVLDIAFLKIPDTKGKKLMPAILGDSTKVQVGDPVVAIGNALGQFENTVTSGIISGHGRSLQASSEDGSASESLENLFQTDAAINQGNSGGPLVNLDGEVIGINTAVAASGQGIGFAIPISDLQGLIKSVQQTGKLQRPYLGVVYVPLTDDVAQQYKLNVTRGAYVVPSGASGQASIVSGGPAEKAGVKEGDIITKVGNDQIDQNNSLTGLLGKHSVGEKVSLSIVRGDKTITIEVTLEAAAQG